MKILLISGKAQHGKDTTAGILREQLEADGYRVLVAHYADLLKFICRQYFEWNGKKDEVGRHTLQYVGTDIIRKEHPDYWVDFLAGFLKMFPGEWDYVLIPDCRFPNEVEVMKLLGSDVYHLRVFRQNFESPLTPEQQRHPSETALDDTLPDYYINNFGSLDDLKVTISKWLVDFNECHQISIDELERA